MNDLYVFFLYSFLKVLHIFNSRLTPLLLMSTYFYILNLASFLPNWFPFINIHQQTVHVHKYWNVATPHRLNKKKSNILNSKRGFAQLRVRTWRSSWRSLAHYKTRSQCILKSTEQISFVHASEWSLWLIINLSIVRILVARFVVITAQIKLVSNSPTSYKSCSVLMSPSPDYDPASWYLLKWHRGFPLFAFHAIGNQAHSEGDGEPWSVGKPPLLAEGSHCN